jgi:hypothetical protein
MNKIFSDDLFPPNETSLLKGFRFSKNSQELPKKWSKIKWVRSKEIFPNCQIFREEIDPNEIKQGALDNFYFLCVVSALSEYRNRIKNIFLTDITNQYGVYGIRLYLNGIPEEIIVDDYFPLDTKKNISCFSSAGEGTVWLQILEKCYAKAYGSYYLTEKGFPVNVLRDFTGAPTLTVENSDENLLTILKEACEKRWVITAYSGENQESKDLLKEIGIIPMNTYTVLDLHELAFENEFGAPNLNNFSNLTNINSLNHLGSVEYILKIRNPWGKNEWIGDWSDFSSLMKENLNLNNSKGCFFMNFKDFKHYFSKIQICKINDSYLYNFLPMKVKFNSYCLVKVKVSSPSPSYAFNYNFNPTYVNFSIVHKNKRCDYDSKIPIKYPTSRLIICKLISKDGDEYNLDYIGGKLSLERELNEERLLTPGDYLIFCEIDYSPNFSTEIFDLEDFYPFVFTSYSQNEVKLSEECIDSYPNILEKIYCSCAKKGDNFVKFTNEGAPECYK